MVSANAPQRLLWNDRSVVPFVALAFLVTVTVVAFQLVARREIGYDDGVLIFYRLFLFEDYPGSYLLLAALLVALVPKVQDAGESLAIGLGRYPLATAAAVCVALAAGSVWVYQAYPLAMDEFAPYLQSQIFASGEVVGQFPPSLLDRLVYPGFQNYFIHVSRETGQIASSYWPGFALLLTPFMYAGVPWLCNPVIGSLSVLAIHRLTVELTGSRQAGGAAVLFSLASGAFVINAISFYSMSTHLLCNVTFVLLLLKPTALRAWMAGVVGGFALTLQNPVPHILFAGPWLMIAMASKDRWRLLPALLVGYLPWIVLAGFGWIHLLQEIGHRTAVDPALVNSSPLVQAIRTFLRVFKLPNGTSAVARLICTAKLWLWAAPGLMLLAGVGFWRHRHDGRFQLLLASAAVTFVAYLFVPLSQGHGWGYRYFHSAWFVLPVFAAAAIVPNVRGADPRARSAPDMIGRYVMGASLVGLLVMVPFFAWQVHAFIRGHLAQLPVTDHGRPRVVIINPSLGYYARDLVHNDPFLRGTEIRMLTRGRKADEQTIASHFPGLVQLSRTYRGSVWGYRDDASATASGGVALRTDEHRQ